MLDTPSRPELCRAPNLKPTFHTSHVLVYWSLKFSCSRIPSCGVKIFLSLKNANFPGRGPILILMAQDNLPVNMLVSSFLEESLGAETGETEVGLLLPAVAGDHAPSCPCSPAHSLSPLTAFTGLGVCMSGSDLPTLKLQSQGNTTLKLHLLS